MALYETRKDRITAKMSTEEALKICKKREAKKCLKLVKIPVEKFPSRTALLVYENEDEEKIIETFLKKYGRNKK